MDLKSIQTRNIGRKRRNKIKGQRTNVIAENPTAPGIALSHATNQTLMPNINTGVQSFSNVCSVPSVVPINLSQLFPANVPGTSLSSTTNQTQIPNVNTGIQSHSWHSGMSPHPYELVPLPSIAQKCYGCGNIFTDEYRSPPYNLVVKHVDRRVIRRDDRTQQLVYGLDFCNTYYHPQITHIKRKNPIFPALHTFRLTCLRLWTI